MTRMAVGETITVKPKHNVFTWMAGAAVVPLVGEMLRTVGAAG